MRVILLLPTLLVTAAAVLPRAAAGQVRRDAPVPRLTIDLDAAPEDRWAPVLKHWDLEQLRNLWISAIDDNLPYDARPLMDVVGLAIEDLLPQPYADELKGISKTLNITLGEITVVNMLYEFSAACTSIVAQDSNGTIWHSRNLDFEMTAQLKNITAILDFKSKGKTVYTTTNFVGQVGVFTGMKPNKFTISLNERDKGSIAANMVELLKALLLKKVKFTSLIARDTLLNAESYEEAFRRLVYEEEVAPVYIILGGVNPGEGAVITRERTAPLDVWEIDVADGRWFLLETNYDHWVPPPASDDRRDPGNKAMRAVGQKNINNKTLWGVLTTPLVLNNSTVYTASMCAGKPEIYATEVRDV
ncbi:N-acylethanolamine-hydrolyzing acid amidase-like [Diadema setosum]|uniref:N-acylethanolamine-hydrolyzing acid amidase-like n=1 Tax=Diadema setosum TaxID=31175 RepID=UPI003B3BAD7A